MIQKYKYFYSLSYISICVAYTFSLTSKVVSSKTTNLSLEEVRVNLFFIIFDVIEIDVLVITMMIRILCFVLVTCYICFILCKDFLFYDLFEKVIYKSKYFYIMYVYILGQWFMDFVQV